MSLEVAIFCDGCSSHGHAGKSARGVRAELRELGWRTALEGGRDLCPECAEREEEKAEARAAA